MFVQSVKKYPINSWIIWVGAGVSFSAPSSLPLGGRLCEFALQETCGDFVPIKIFSIWERANEAVSEPENLAPLGPLPRLETVVEAINDVQLQAKNCRFDFMKGFESLRAAPYNENHLHLACLLLRGATIVTTNFDTCIQKAYQVMCKEKDELILGRDKGIYYYSSKYNARVGRIWHVHGIANDTSSLGTTIHSIKEGVPPTFQKFLDARLKKPSALIFLGYSASDSFDINLYFSRKKAAEFKNSLGVFIQHGNNDAPPNARLVVNCFGNKVIEKFDTTNALKLLSEIRHTIIPPNSFMWERSFLKHSVLADKDKIKDYVLCKIAFNLGINVRIIDPLAYRRALANEQLFDPVDFHKTLALLCRLQGDAKRERGHDEAVKKGEKDLLGFFYAQGNLRKALRRAKSVDELFRDASSKSGELDWSTYTSMSAHSRPLVIKYLLSPHPRIHKADRIKMESLLRLASMLGAIPLKNVRYVNQVATALRFQMLFNALLNNLPEEDIAKQILHLYGEGASIIGYVSAYRDIAISSYFLSKYHKRDVHSRATSYVNRSLALARLIGDATGARRAQKLLIYFRLFH